MLPQKEFDVSVIGGAGFDTNSYLYHDEINFDIEVNFSVNKDCIGGSGGYCSISFSKLDLKTAFIGALGEDIYGNQILNHFKDQNIDTSAIIVDLQGTKRSVNIIYNNGNRKNFYDAKGAFDIDVNIEKVGKILSQSKLAHFSIINWTRKLLPVAQELGLIISTDLQDVVNIEDNYRLDYLEYSDIIFFSAANLLDPLHYINEYFSRFPNIKLIIVGNGDKGCILGTRTEIKHYPPVKFNLKVSDTNGAGDSLSTGFLSSYYFHNYSLAKSITRGQINARYTCTLNSTPENMLTLSQLNKFHEEYKIKNEIEVK